MKKREQQGRAPVKEFVPPTTKTATKEELTEIELFKREANAILELDRKVPIKYVGFRVEQGMDDKERARRKQENEIEQEEIYLKWEEAFKKEALKVKHLFVNTRYWFFKKYEHCDLVKAILNKNDFPVVERANVTGEKEIDDNVEAQNITSNDLHKINSFFKEE